MLITVHTNTNTTENVVFALLQAVKIKVWSYQLIFLHSGSTLCFLHLLIPSRPLILSGNDTIILGPYHTYYGKLEEHMQRVGLSVQPNMWDQPLCIGKKLKMVYFVCIHVNNTLFKTVMRESKTTDLRIFQVLSNFVLKS